MVGKITDKALNGGIGASAALEQSMEGYVPNNGSQDNSESTNGGTPVIKLSGGVLGPYGRVIEMLEVNRTSWFNVVTQFNALFKRGTASSSAYSAHPPAFVVRMADETNAKAPI